MSKVRQIIPMLIVVLILIIGLVVFLVWRNSAKGMATLDLTSVGPSGVEATINNRPVSLKFPKTTLKLDNGNYVILVKKANFKDFSTKFTIKNTDVTINVVLEQVQKPEVNSLSQSSIDLGSSADTYVKNASINSVKYFDQNNWAVVQFVDEGLGDNSGNSGWAILKFDSLSQKWTVVLGPGTYFETSDLSGLPPDVTTYFKGLGVVSNG